MADRMTESERYVREDVPVTRTERSSNTSWILIAILVVLALAAIVWAASGTNEAVPTTQTTIEAPAPAPTAPPPADSAQPMNTEPMNTEATPEQPAAPTVTEPAVPEPTTPAPAPAQ
jgi:hypothetical protein